MATDDKLNEEVDQFMAEKGWQFMAYAVNRHFSIQEDQKPVVKKLGPKSARKHTKKESPETLISKTLLRAVSARGLASLPMADGETRKLTRVTSPANREKVRKLLVESLANKGQTKAVVAKKLPVNPKPWVP